MDSNQNQLQELFVDGMSCANCAMGVKKRLEKQGMQSVDVNFATGEVRFENVVAKPLSEVSESIEDLGYTVRMPDAAPDTQKKNF
ncbi:MAG: heavy metal-associated domain-containing protein [Bacteroidota bacterium]|nr:heavy metal-associated domain-containing protein [Bacteroidota bacterium]